MDELSPEAARLLADARAATDAGQRLECLRRACLVAPEHPQARTALAQALLREGVAAAKASDKPRARLLLRELSALTPEDDRAWMWRASVAQGYQEAHECVTRVLAMSPDHPQARAALACLEVRAARGRSAAVSQPLTAAGLHDSPAPPVLGPPAAAAESARAGATAAETPAPMASAVSPPPEAERASPVSPPLRARVSGFSPAATVFRAPEFETPTDTSRPGSVLHLFDEPSDREHAAPARVEPRVRPPAAHPIGFRPPFAEPSAVGRDRAPDVPPRPPLPADRQPARGTVLVVDDSPTVLKLVEYELTSQRVEVLTAASGPAALERLLSATPDLVLLDADMPLMDGYQVCRAIRGEDRTRLVPVVIMTSGDGLAERMRCRFAGAAGHLAKPLQAAALGEVLDRHLPVRF